MKTKGRPQSARGKVAETYCNRFKKTPSRSLSRKVFEENKLLFSSAEDARTLIMMYRRPHKKNGMKKRDINGTGVENNPFNISKSVSVDTKPLILKKADNNIGIISDLHIPNHRVEPLTLAYKYFIKKKVNTIIINGDFLDNTPFTKHDCRQPSAKETKEWFDIAELELERLRNLFPDARILWLEGNHDNWYKRWLMKHAPMLFDDEHFHLRERLHLDDYNIEFIDQEQYVMAGKLAICHGHHIIKGIFAPVNAARGAYLKAKRSVLIGHVHVESSHTESDLHGDIVTTWSTGCLCTLTPSYQPMAGKACHGFAHVEINRAGNYRVNNFRIHKNQIL
jgi:predicted phosphodiesterase